MGEKEKRNGMFERGRGEGERRRGGGGRERRKIEGREREEGRDSPALYFVV
jgi:hypothetical protein